MLADHPELDRVTVTAEAVVAVKAFHQLLFER